MAKKPANLSWQSQRIINRLPRCACRDGFTLIELSIVLVIVGLLVGGVLVGQDLIRAAKIRSQIGQIEQFTLASQAFRLKYDSKPGDMLGTKAVKFGFRVNLVQQKEPTHFFLH